MAKLYIAVLDEFPDHMTPTLVAHAVLGAHLTFHNTPYESAVRYNNWLENSFKKCVVRVNQKEFSKIAALPYVYLGHENNTLEGRESCAVVCPMPREEIPNVLKFAKLWKPNVTREQWNSFNKVLHWINTQDEKMISKGDLYDAVMEMRPEA
jgi:hypothetical protein